MEDFLKQISLYFVRVDNTILVLTFFIFALIVTIVFLFLKKEDLEKENIKISQKLEYFLKEIEKYSFAQNKLENILDEQRKTNQANLIKIAELEKELLLKQRELEDKTKELNLLKNKNESLNEQNVDLKNHISFLEANLKNQKELHEKLKDEYEYQNQLLEKNLEKIMNDHIEKKIKKLDDSAIKNIDLILKPLKQNIDDFKNKVSDTHRQNIEYFSKLSKEIEYVLNAGLNISKEAKNLADALKGSKQAQGRWGEIVLESILEKSGLIKDEHYLVQKSFINEEGEVKKPDVIVRLPNKKSIIIDSKVSLINYDNYIKASTKEEQKKYIKLLVQDVKNHINTLFKKEYLRYHNETFEYIFMFVPIEGAFSLCLKEDLELYEYALKRKIVILSPTTLIVSLKTIYLYWQSVQSNKNAIKLFEEAGKLYDKVATFVDNFATLGGQIENVFNNYQKILSLLSTGRGNILQRTQNLKKLGAKTIKTLDKNKIDFDELEIDELKVVFLKDLKKEDKSKK